MGNEGETFKNFHKSWNIWKLQALLKWKLNQEEKLTIFVLYLLAVSISLPTIFPAICLKRRLLSIIKVWLLHILPNSV